MVENGSSEVSSKSIVRDASGRATRVVESLPGISAFVDYIYLNPSGSRVRNGLLKFDFGGIPVTESIAFQVCHPIIWLRSMWSVRVLRRISG